MCVRLYVVFGVASIGLSRWFGIVGHLHRFALSLSTFSHFIFQCLFCRLAIRSRGEISPIFHKMFRYLANILRFSICHFIFYRFDSMPEDTPTVLSQVCMQPRSMRYQARRTIDDFSNFKLVQLSQRTLTYRTLTHTRKQTRLQCRPLIRFFHRQAPSVLFHFAVLALPFAVDI